MRSYDPARELEITERGLRAMTREAEQPRIELHRRVIDARRQQRHHDVDDLLRRITLTLDVP